MSRMIIRQCRRCDGDFVTKLAEGAQHCSLKCAGESRSARSADAEAKNLERRFWERLLIPGRIVIPSLGPCHEWTAATDGHGYGQIRIGPSGKSRLIKAHRLGFFLHYGRWPEPFALHNCDNPPCVRWEHLREGTALENMADMNRRGRNGSVKFPIEMIAEARALLASGETQADVAARLGISLSHVHRIAHERTRLYGT